MQLSFDLIENLGSGKLLGCGDNVNTEPENLSKSFIETRSMTSLPDIVDDDDDKTLETSFGKSFGSGPNGTVDSISKISCSLSSNFFALFLGCFDFFGVRE